MLTCYLSSYVLLSLSLHLVLWREMASLKFHKINLRVRHGNVLIKKVSIICRGLTFEGETRGEILKPQGSPLRMTFPLCALLPCSPYCTPLKISEGSYLLN